MPDLNADFVRGAWFAFDTVLGWINVQTEQSINKKELYKAVLQLRPQSIILYTERD